MFHMSTLMVALADWQTIIPTLLGAVVGFASGVISDIFKARREEKRKAVRLQKALYFELGEVYKFVSLVTSGGGYPGGSDEKRAMVELVPLDVYRVAKSQPDIFYLLPEALELDNIFSAMYFAQRTKDPRMELAYAGAFPMAVENAVKNQKIDGEVFQAAHPVTYGAILKKLNIYNPD
jgi:hypothetical protein